MRMRFRIFSCGYILTNLHRSLIKKQVIHMFGINIVVFNVVFYSQGVLSPVLLSVIQLKNCESKGNDNDRKIFNTNW